VTVANKEQIMEAYCVFLMGNFLAINKFAKDFGFFSEEKQIWVVETKWQSAIQASGPLGALIGCFLAGPLTSRIGYRWATIAGLMLLNAFIFVFYFAKTIEVMFASQILEGIPWGIFIANAPAYCSEIVPMRLRAPCTQMLQMFWAIGAIIVGAVTYQYNELDTETAYRYVSDCKGECRNTDIKTDFQLPSSGCFQHLWPFSCSSLLSRLGGSSAKDAWRTP
jgi:SP family general alpha glucoside:H+ symporter-like MFS transporter